MMICDYKICDRCTNPICESQNMLMFVGMSGNKMTFQMVEVWAGDEGWDTIWFERHLGGIT